MSHLASESVSCPVCGVEQQMTLFRSLNGERVPAQVQLLLDGSFERHACASCGRDFRPEHRMLYAHVAARVWVVMYPLADRPRFATLEHGLALVFAHNVAHAPELVGEFLAQARPRLVFGQHMLSESVRIAHGGVDPALLECAKLLAYRRNLATLLPHGPAELCYEGTAEEGALRLAIHRLGDGRRAGELRVAGEAMQEVASARAEFAERYPELFARPYVSATRYLFGAMG